MRPFRIPIIVILVIPALVADPALAGLAGISDHRISAGSIRGQADFTRQALIPAAVEAVHYALPFRRIESARLQRATARHRGNPGAADEEETEDIAYDFFAGNYPAKA